MNSMIRALALLGQYELTATVSVADMTVYLGISSARAAYVVTANDKMEKVICTPRQARAVLTLFVEGDEVENAEALYECLCSALPKDPDLRPIP